MDLISCNPLTYVVVCETRLSVVNERKLTRFPVIWFHFGVLSILLCKLEIKKSQTYMGRGVGTPILTNCKSPVVHATEPV